MSNSRCPRLGPTPRIYIGISVVLVIALQEVFEGAEREVRPSRRFFETLSGTRAFSGSPVQNSKLPSTGAALSITPRFSSLGVSTDRTWKMDCVLRHVHSRFIYVVWPLGWVFSLPLAYSLSLTYRHAFYLYFEEFLVNVVGIFFLFFDGLNDAWSLSSGRPHLLFLFFFCFLCIFIWHSSSSSSAYLHLKAVGFRRGTKSTNCMVQLQQVVSARVFDDYNRRIKYSSIF